MTVYENEFGAYVIEEERRVREEGETLVLKRRWIVQYSHEFVEARRKSRERHQRWLAQQQAKKNAGE